jgi:hypothetical protein
VATITVPVPDSDFRSRRVVGLPAGRKASRPALNRALSDQEVIELRARVARHDPFDTQQDIADDLGVSAMCVSNCAARRTYKDVA